MAASNTCSNCHIQNPPGRPHCRVCGTPLAQAGGLRAVAPAAPVPLGAPAQQQPASLQQRSLGLMLFGWLGWRRLEGLIIQATPPYQVQAQSHPFRTLFVIVAILGLGLLALASGARLVWALLPILLPIGVLWLMWRGLFTSRSGPQVTGPSFLRAVATQVVGFFLTNRLIARAPSVPVRDFRLRDAAGTEHLVRATGDLVQGTLDVGDDVLVEGFVRGGTLNLHHGMNRRVRARIRLRTP